MYYLLFLSNPYHDILSGVEKHLPTYLSKYNKVLCFEHPQFLASILYLLRNKPLLEKISTAMYVYHSIGFLPYGRSFQIINYFNHFLNLFLLKILSKDKDFWQQSVEVITFTPEAIYIIPKIRDVNKIVYYVCDDYTGLPYWKSKYQQKQFCWLEKKLLYICGKVLVVSPALYKKYTFRHKNVVMFLIPSHSKIFLDYTINKKTSSYDLLGISHPVAGFIGNYIDWKINTRFIIQLIKKFSTVNFVFLGTINIQNEIYYKKIISLPNVFYLGSKNITELPEFVVKFDVCLIPYRINNWGQSAYPVKIMEYLALGKPVVTTALPSIKYLSDKGLIYWARNDNEFIKFIKIALKEKKGSVLIKARMAEARKNDWGIRIKEFIRIIEDD